MGSKKFLIDSRFLQKPSLTIYNIRIIYIKSIHHSIPEEFERNHETTCNFNFKIKRSNQITKNRKKMSKDDEEVLLDYNEEDDAVQEPTKEKEVKASK